MKSNYNFSGGKFLGDLKGQIPQKYNYPNFGELAKFEENLIMTVGGYIKAFEELQERILPQFPK